MKAKTMFYCTSCGNETLKWQGQCPACGAWNTIVEQPAAPKTKKGTGVKSAISMVREEASRNSFCNFISCKQHIFTQRILLF